VLHADRHAGEAALAQDRERPRVDGLRVGLRGHLGAVLEPEALPDPGQDRDEVLRRQQRRGPAAEEHGGDGPLAQRGPGLVELEQRGRGEARPVAAARQLGGRVGVEVAVAAAGRAERHVDVQAERGQAPV
jgi:hypothetical protein